MKMGAGLFWGAFLLLLGVALIIKVVFNVEFPVFKVLVGIFLVLLGVKVIFGKFLISPSHFKAEETIFNERVYDNPESDKEYTVLFAKGVYDFTNVDLEKGSFRAKVSTVFGGTQIIIPRDKPVRIKADAVFAGAELPDGNSAVFGTTIYESDSYRPDTASIDLKVEVVFGGVQVIQR
jgi:predicted membrane protein